MNGPPSPDPYPDRHIDCQMALEDQFIALMEMAEKAGWSVEEAAAAVVDLADNYVLKLRANAGTDRVIADAIRRSDNTHD